MKRIVGIVLVVLCLLPVFAQSESEPTEETPTFNQYQAELCLYYSN